MAKLYEIDGFIQSALAIRYKGITKVKASGFRAYMKSKDMMMVDDENKFKKELDFYLTH